jgi:uncharacterized protein YutE (UPF0331/DUF86 family)
VETAEAVAATEPELAEAPAQELSPGPAGLPALSSQLAYEIHRHPRAAVIEAWIAVEQELDALARAAGVDPGGRRRTMAVTSQLRDRGVISPALASVLTELKQARNIAAHTGQYPLDSDEVREYVKLSGRVRDALRTEQERLHSKGGDSEPPQS